MTGDSKERLIAEARIARQREEVARLEARGSDTREAKSLLSGMVYSLRVLRRHHQRHGQKDATVRRLEQNDAS